MMYGIGMLLNIFSPLSCHVTPTCQTAIVLLTASQVYDVVKSPVQLLDLQQTEFGENYITGKHQQFVPINCNYSTV